jgi:hypothetical protein
MDAPYLGHESEALQKPLVRFQGPPVAGLVQQDRLWGWDGTQGTMTGGGTMEGLKGRLGG